MKKELIFFIMLIISISGCKDAQIKETKFNSVDRIFDTSKDYLNNYNYEISLDDAINIARERNLQYLSKKIEAEIATLDKKIAFGNFFPSINAGMTYSRISSPVDLETSVDIPPFLGGGSTDNLQILDKESHSFGISAQMPVFVPSLWYLYSARKKGEDTSKIIKELADKKIQLLVMDQYYKILTLEDNNKSLRTQVKSATALNQESKIALKVEAINSWQFEKSKVNLKSKKLMLDKNKRDLQIAKMKLMESLNLDPFTDFKLKPSKNIAYQELTLENCILRALNNNDMIKIATNLDKIEDDKIKIALSNFLPKVVAGTGYLNTSNSVLTDPDFLYGNVSGMVSIFNGFKNVNEYKKAKKKKKISELKLEEEFLKTIVETAKAYKNYENINQYYDLVESNYYSEKLKIKQNKNEYTIGLINQSKYYEYLSEFEKSEATLNHAKYLKNLSRGVLNITMGEYPLINIKGVKE